MMVVLVVLMLLMGLAIGSIFAAGPANRLLATEHLIADFVRQARHTARSSGSPVILQITRDTALGLTTVSGVSRICVWSETFEPQSPLSTNTLYTFGQSGVGKLRQAAVLGEVAIPIYTLLPRERIDRPSSSTRTEGFYLACNVRPPAVGGTQVPLVSVGADADIMNSVCGLRLIPYNVTASGTGAGFTVWELAGWVRRAGATSIDEASPFAGGVDVAGAISGDRWEDVGLLFDGRQLILYRNSQELGRVDLGADAKLEAGDNIFVGQIIDSTLVPPSGLINATACIDDARLYRLGTDQLGRLPNGINAGADYSIVAQPDGRVEINSQGAPQSDMTFSGSFAGSAGALNRARITVTADGRVSSKLEAGP
jgi:hypothetical protein